MIILKILVIIIKIRKILILNIFNLIKQSMQKRYSPRPKKKIQFVEDQINFQNEQNDEKINWAQFEQKTQEQDQSPLNDISDQFPQNQQPPNYQQEFSTLEELIKNLNQKDQSQDEGIEDYKIGGYHPCYIGEILVNRYVLIQKLGWGHFSTVWLAKDFSHKNYVAVKIMKSSPHYLEASYDEVQILQKVANKAYDPQWLKSLQQYQPNRKKSTFNRDDCHVLHLLNSFLYKGPYGNHFCMVFEILGVNLLEVLKRYEYKGLPLNQVKEITRQVLMGLDYLNRICRVIHTDLKPQNVLLCLTPQQIQTIVEKGQLEEKQKYQDRLNFYRRKYYFQQQISFSKQIKSKAEQLQQKLIQSIGNPKLMKNYRKKINKLEQKGKKQVQQKLKNKKSVAQLFECLGSKTVFNKEQKLPKGFKVKIADLGNACWQHHHFATQIQTRQYRSPEVLTGSKYNLTADMWSLACMTFEMLTGQLLFNPQKDMNQKFGKTDDHLAQMMELLGRFPTKFSLRGNKSKKYFNQKDNTNKKDDFNKKYGSLRRIPKLQNWGLKDIMIFKYRFKENSAKLFEQFMLPMLECMPQNRLLANQMLKYSWLSNKEQDYLMDSATYQKIRKQKYNLQIPLGQIAQYQSEKEDGSDEDNSLNTNSIQNDDEFYGYQKIGDIRYIDRSFMDLGYVGYGDGIFLEKLDTGSNWQFT